MKNAPITGSRISIDVVDGPGWTDVDVYYSNETSMFERSVYKPKLERSVCITSK